ncbi:UNVERIFIED_CONTAM: hypothetical protein FKN15_027329, partial [Acipenser sinensis]
CHGLRHLANGRTFFRYGGIYATFTCNPGFRVYGYRTSSCVSGRWTRASPVCIAAGCPSSGGTLHGSSTVNQDRSLIFFKCDKGYKLFGSPVLYCNGKTWNSTEPVCKESDIMSSDKFKHLNLISTNLGQSLNAPSALRNIFRIQYGNIANSAAKDIFLKQELLPEPPRALNPKSGQQDVALRQLQESNSVPDNQVEDVYLQEHHQSGRASSWGQSPSKDNNKEPTGYQKSLSKALEVPLATTSPTTSIPSVTMSTFKTPIISSSTPAKDTMFSSSTASYTLKSIASDSPLFNESTLSELPASSAPREDILPLPTSAPDLKQLPLTSAMEVEIETSVSAPNVPSPSINDSSPLEQSVLPDNTVTATLPRYGTVTSELKGDSSQLSSQVLRATPLALEPETVTASSEVTPCAVNNGGCSQVCKAGSQKQTECSCREGFTLLEDGRTCRDVNECTEGQHYCQQACVNTFGSYECSCRPGYLLAEDERSCSDRDECTVNNGGCLHHCTNTFGSYRCYCEPGFELEKDQRHCRELFILVHLSVVLILRFDITPSDLDECQTSIGIAGCLFGCINTLGSFLCHCPEGYALGAMDGHCRDIDECAENNGRGLCAMECQNAPGSYHCSCSYGYRLGGDGRSCIAECPSGYRKHRNSTERSSPHQRNEQCVGKY